MLFYSLIKSGTNILHTFYCEDLCDLWLLLLLLLLLSVAPAPAVVVVLVVVISCCRVAVSNLLFYVDRLSLVLRLQAK